MVLLLNILRNKFFDRWLVGFELNDKYVYVVKGCLSFSLCLVNVIEINWMLNVENVWNEKILGIVL